MRDAINQKSEQAAKLKKDIEDFLASGGVIKQIPFGVCTLKDGELYVSPYTQRPSKDDSE